MIKIDNFYFVVENIEKSVEFYTALLNQKPTNITEKRWADWENNQGQIYFGIISKKSADCKLIKGNNAVLGLYTENLEEETDEFDESEEDFDDDFDDEEIEEDKEAM